MGMYTTQYSDSLPCSSRICPKASSSHLLWPSSPPRQPPSKLFLPGFQNLFPCPLFHHLLLSALLGSGLQRDAWNGQILHFQNSLEFISGSVHFIRFLLYIGIAPCCPRCSKQSAGEGGSSRFGTVWVLSAARHRLWRGNSKRGLPLFFLPVFLYFIACVFVFLCLCVCISLPVCLHFFDCVFYFFAPVFTFFACVFLLCLYVFLYLYVFCLFVCIVFTRIFVLLCLRVCIYLRVCLLFWLCVCICLPACLQIFACIFCLRFFILPACLYFFVCDFVFLCLSARISLPVCCYFFAWATVCVCIFAWTWLTNCVRALAVCVLGFMKVFV